MSSLTIVLIVLGVVFVLGAGSCLLLGGLVLLGASAERADAGPSPTSTPPPTTILGGDEDPPTDDGTPSKTGATGAASPAAAPATGSGKWMCNGTGWVRVCGFTNVCNNMMMSGMGVSTDRQQAYTMAKSACEGQIRARGGAGACNVACTPNAH